MQSIEETKVVILAGGRGTRMGDEGAFTPKPMISIGGRPMLWHIMKMYGAVGAREFIICLGYRGYVIKDYFANFMLHNADAVIDLEAGSIDFSEESAEPWRVTLVDTGLDTGTGGRLARIGELVRDDDYFCMTYGDGFADLDLAASIEHHLAEGRAATMTVVPAPARFGAVELDGRRVSRFSEKPIEGHGMINGGFFVLSPACLDVIDGDSATWEREPLERLAADGQLSAYLHDGFWEAMDTPREREHLEALWQGGNAPWKTW